MFPKNKQCIFPFIVFCPLFCILLFMSCFLKNESNNPELATELLQSSDFEYVGAFRLPSGDSGSEVESWAYGGQAMTYFPGGDSAGADDGHPGSLFATGHAWEYQVSEISIPVPVVSSTKNPNDLNVATTLQRFKKIIEVGHLEIPRVGLTYLPKQGDQSSDKLYFGWGAHFQEPNDLTHGWCELDLSNPKTAGEWYLDCPHNVYNTNDYLLQIPESWALAYTPGKLLACGRFRDGGWSGQGPSLFAFGPWNHGNPPPDGSSLHYVTLLRYTSSEDFDEPVFTMNGYHHSDEWSGAVWISVGNKSAVIFAGTKGVGDCWYGDQNGPCDECEGDRGWWSTGFEGQFNFYDPNDLAQVTQGIVESWEPQPYTSMNIDQHLFGINSTQQKYHLGAIAFDRDRGFLYVFEPMIDENKPIIHVWKVEE